MALGILGVLLFACGSGERHKDRAFAREMAAIRSLHNLDTAQTQYSSAYQRYAATLAELGPPPSPEGKAAPGAADLIPADLASGTKNGYVFTLAPRPGGYTIHANPQTYGVTGRRSFYTDESHRIRQHDGKEPASAKDPEVQ